jgi:sugar lactone lactonase YvrE
LGLWLLPPVGRLAAGVGDGPGMETVFQFSLAPAGLTASLDGNWVLGVNQSQKPRLRAVMISKGGEVKPFPNEKMSTGDPSIATPLDAIEGLQTDKEGVIWMLDNGRRSEVPPKIIAWSPDRQRVLTVYNLSPPAVVPGSYLSDMVVDPLAPFIYVSDPANGSNAALIVLDRTSGIARRVLQGHPSVVPDAKVPLRTTGSGLEIKRLDGTATLPHCGVRPLALDRKSSWLYYTAVQSHNIWRVPVEMLRNADAAPEKLAAAAASYAEKPVCASIVLDSKSNLYVGDIEGRSIGVIEAGAKPYRVLASDPRLLWPDDLCFGIDGSLYFFSRTQPAPPLNRDKGAITVEHSMFRMKPLAPGKPGD